MDILKELFLNPKFTLTFFGGIIILAVIWNLYEHTFNLLTNEQKNNSVFILSVTVIFLLLSSLYLL